jgi:hypothetical protein
MFTSSARRNLILLPAFAATACLSGRKHVMTSPIMLTATADHANFRTGEPIPVRLALRNASPSTIWVNRRLGAGYEDSVEREIYFTVFSADGAVIPVPDEARVDVHRMPPVRADFSPLDPAASIDATLDAAMWYPFRQAGKYRIVFTYENRRDGNEFGIGALLGKVSADPLSIVIER